MMKMETIQFAGLDLQNRQVVGVIPKVDGSNGEPTFFKTTILELSDIARLPQNTVRVVVREKDGAPENFTVIMFHGDGRAIEGGEDIVTPVLISADATELDGRPLTPLKDGDLDDVRPLLVLG